MSSKENKDLVLERSEIEAEYKWKLSDLYRTEEDWTEAKLKAKEAVAAADQFRGKVMASADDLLKVLTYMDDLTKDLTRLSCFASMSSDEDTRIAKYQDMKQEIGQLYTDYSAKISYIEPELLAAEPSTIDSYLNENKDLQPFDFYLQDLLRIKKHRNSEEVEKVIAQAGLMAGNASSIYSIFFNADFPFPTVTLSNGEEVELNFPNFSRHRGSKNREDRSSVFNSFFNKIGSFERTFGVQLYGHLKKDVFYSKARNYDSTLESALDRNNIPTAVYHNLIENVNHHLDTFHRYLGLRKKMMGLDSLHYYDLYAPLVSEVDLSFELSQGKQDILASLKPLGEDYQSVVERAFNEGWIDMYPNKGKRSGAYSNGAAYDVHPFILMNFNGKYDDVSTLTHELGHTMHSYLSNKQQPHAKANYSIFVAEVASTLNEELLNEHLLNQIEDEQVRLSILGNYLEGAKGTLFRQTQFAEFEWLIHKEVESGESLTGEKFSKLYQDLTKKYYGHDSGICIVDDFVKYEWAYIPHFYYNYYVYQYATSFTASQALVEQLLKGSQKDRDRYLNFLSSGGSAYPIDLLRMAGVDMESVHPFELTIQKMNRVMDEIEKILE
ncbi:oligoendopeptidase F [Membranihabitans marinus]|uniref:oligoendopeptidase F n=1 Tax=Membranihabitans marinus TaxID=1227546 RepID=UPI001EFF955C|nr:oligoendopeptidase F [Membranihabitans marinus]